jgi:hypothetical protein
MSEKNGRLIEILSSPGSLLLSLEALVDTFFWHW